MNVDLMVRPFKHGALAPVNFGSGNVRPRKRSRSEASDAPDDSDARIDGDPDLSYTRLARKRKTKKRDKSPVLNAAPKRSSPPNCEYVGKENQNRRDNVRDAGRNGVNDIRVDEKPTSGRRVENHESQTSSDSSEQQQPSVVKRAKQAITHFWSSSSSSLSRPKVGEEKQRDLEFAGLDNVGNTCFVNSCLYALRFLPEFPTTLHKFNSEVVKLRKKEQKMSDEANAAADLVLSMHEVFQQLRKNEMENAGKKSPDSFRPVAFVDAFQSSQPSYHKGEQFDAHEFLFHVLNSMGVLANEIHRLLEEDAKKLPAIEDAVDTSTPDFGFCSGRLRRRRKPGKLPMSVNPWALARAESFNSFLKTVVNNITHSGASGFGKSRRKRGKDQSGTGDEADAKLPKKGDQVAATWDYQERHMTGTCVVRTACLECEESMRVEEFFTHISIPVDAGGVDSAVAILDRLRPEEEILSGENKIFCETCVTRQPAKRTMAYTALPSVLVLHLKRFSTYFSSRTSRVETEKATRFLETPTSLPCFCSGCTSSSPDDEGVKKHQGYILQCVVEHQGSISCGHYISYSRLPLPLVRQNLASRTEENVNGFKAEDSDAAACCCPSAAKSDPDDKMSESPGPWVKCDDCYITRLSENDVIRILGDHGSKPVTPYLLIYARVRGDAAL